MPFFWLSRMHSVRRLTCKCKSKCGREYNHTSCTYRRVGCACVSVWCSFGQYCVRGLHHQAEVARQPPFYLLIEYSSWLYEWRMHGFTNPFSVNVCGFFVCTGKKMCGQGICVFLCVCACVSRTSFCIDPWPAVLAPLHSLFQMKADVLVLWCWLFHTP